MFVCLYVCMYVWNIRHTVLVIGIWISSPINTGTTFECHILTLCCVRRVSAWPVSETWWRFYNVYDGDICLQFRMEFKCWIFEVWYTVATPFSSLYEELSLHMLRCPLRSLRTMRECLFFIICTSHSFAPTSR